MATYSLLNRNTFIFILVMIFTALVLSIYLTLVPEQTMPFNFMPFPKEAPTSLPDPAHHTDKCWDTLTPCDSFGNCSACSSGEYGCVAVDDENAGLYHFNGISVPAGKWCLPTDNNPQPICNTKTGRWVWTFDEEYCNSVGAGKSQCWKCECLYPSIYADSKGGCNKKVGCVNTNIMAGGVDTQSNNKLVATACANSNLSKANCVWDPSDPSTGTGACESVYDFTPYDKDINGNPWFACSCAAVGPNGQNFTSLPNDPYTCHLDACTKYIGYKGGGMSAGCGRSCSSEGENCYCQCNQTNMAKSPGGDYSGTCVLISNSCGSFGYDETKQSCNCGEGPYWERKCRSPNTNINMDKPELPLCQNAANALGSECYNPCEEKTCNNGAPCISCGPGSTKAFAECAFDDNGNLRQNPDEIHAICACAMGNKPDPTTVYGGYNGPTCSNMCLKGGTHIRTVKGLDSTQHVSSCACCCSQRVKRVDDTAWGIDHHYECDGDWPEVSAPAESVCLPSYDKHMDCQYKA